MSPLMFVELKKQIERVQCLRTPEYRRWTAHRSLDIFGTDVNGRVITAASEPAFADGWHGWWQIGGGAARAGSPVTAVADGGEYSVHQGEPVAALVHRSAARHVHARDARRIRAQ